MITTGFDPKTLKVPQLRNLLVEHDVDYPSSAKKPELIEIFNREIKPKASAILEQQNSVTADATGIIDTTDKKEADLPDSKPKKKKGRPKKETSTDPVDVPEKKTKKLKKVKQPVSSDADTEDEPSDDTEETHFSKKNVFQRASMSPQSNKTSPTKSKLDLSKTLKPSEPKKEDEALLSTPPKATIPKKRSKHHAEDSEDEPAKKKVVKSPKSPAKAKTSKLEKFEEHEGPDLFKASSAKSTPKASITTTGKVSKKSASKKKPSTPKAAHVSKKESGKKSPAPSTAITESFIEESFQSVASEIDNTSRLSDAISSATPSSITKLKNFITASPNYASDLGKRIIASPFRGGESTSATPKGPKKQLGFVDEDVKMEIITPSITDEEQELKKLQDEMSIHLEETSSKVNDVEQEIEIEKASEAVESAFVQVFYKLSSGLAFASFLVVTMIFSIWYLDQKQKIGFCGVEIHERTFKVENYDEFDLEGFLSKKFAPECVPCPEHGQCGTLLRINCDEDFLVSYPWYSFNGFLPFAPACVPDKIKQQRINEMVEYTLDLLRQRNAENCGKESDEVVGLGSSDIHDLLKSSQDNSLSDEKFEELWVKVLEDLKKEPEITSRLRGDHYRLDEDSTDNEEASIQEQDEILRSHSKSKFSLKCRFQEVVYLQLVRFRLEIATIVAVVVISVIAKFQYKSYTQNRQKVDQLTSLVIKKLVQQNKVASKDNTGLTRDYLALVQLRDVLIDDANSKKSKLWSNVVKRVSKNSNIEERTIEVGGEIIKIWKWIGVDIDEDELSS